MKKKIAIKGMLSVMTAMTIFASTAISSFAAGDEVVSFKITTDRMKSYEETKLSDSEKDLDGKIAIISTNDVHGAILDFTYVSNLKNKMEARGAKVILVDSGDFSTDKDVKKYDKHKSDDAEHATDLSNGIAPVKIMNAIGYDIACLGNHEFERKRPGLEAIVNEVNFQYVDANLEGKFLDENAEYREKIKKNYVITPEGTDIKIGFFGLATPESGNWTANCGLSAKSGTKLHDCAREQVEELRGKSDIVIALTHLGVDDDIAKGYVKKDEEGNGLYNDLYEKGYRSVDLFKDVEGIDLMLDGHSHTTMTGCAGDDRANFNIQSAGIQLQNIGVVIIGKDENGQPAILDRYLIPEKYYSQIGEDPKISAYIQYVIDCAKNNKEIQDYDPKDYEDIESISADAASIDSSKDVTADAAVVASTEEDIIDAASTASSLEDSEEATTESSEDIEDSASTEKSEDTSNKKHGKNNHHSHNRKNNHKTGFGGR